MISGEDQPTIASGALDMPRLVAQPRTALIVLGLLVLLAILGWGLYLSVKAGYDAQQGRFNQERTEFTGRIADLEGRLATERGTAAERIAGLENSLARERAAAGDLAALEGRIDHATSELNQRMAVLGERERDRAAAEAALTGVRARLAALTEARDRATARLNQRLQVLGERERDLAETERTLDRTKAERDRLQTEAADLDRTILAKKTALGALDVKLAQDSRAQSSSAAALERTRDALAAAQTRLTAVEAKLDKALLAEGVAQLTASQTTLRQEVASLNAELERKGPLFHQSVSVNQKLLGLDEKLRSLSVERDKLTAELQALVAELGQAQARHGAGVEATTASFAKLTRQ
jgi:predicted  nucleic acid-binding Zn-ribbon protein